MPKSYEQRDAANKERYIICAEDEVVLESCKSDNMSGNEIKIVYLQATVCPIKTACAYIDPRGRSTICKHLTTYPYMGSGDMRIGEALTCGWSRKVIPAQLLKPGGCPINKPNCIACEYLGDIFLRAHKLDKSHAHIKCEKVKK
jgi:hypothetical protein